MLDDDSVVTSSPVACDDVTSSTTSRDPAAARRSDECRVCGDDAAGMYFGALVCVPCKVDTDWLRSCFH